MEKPIKFKDIIIKYKWADIARRLVKLYPDQKKSIKGYEKVFKQLLRLKPKRVDCELCVEVCKDPDYEPHAHVCGWKEKDEFNRWGIEFMTWDKWLGMVVRKETLEQYSELEVICHALWEMTYCGFTQGKVQKEAKELNRRVKEVKKKYKKSKK